MALPVKCYHQANPTLDRSQEIIPDRLVAKRSDESAVRLAIGIGDPWRERCETLPPRHFAGRADTNLPGLRRKDQLRLTGAEQGDIDLGQEFRVEQRAV